MGIVAEEDQQQIPLIASFNPTDDSINRTGTIWTAMAHIITRVIGAGVLLLAWSVARLGRIAGPLTMVVFSAISMFSEMEATVVDGNGTETGHIIITTISGRNGQAKQIIRYMAERVVGQGSFGLVFQAKCLEIGETIAIKKVLQNKRYKNRELQTMRLLYHPKVYTS